MERSVRARSLLAPAPTSPASESTAAERLREPAAKRHTVPGRIWILATLALMCMLCEGVANDWSALEAKNILGAPAATASFGLGLSGCVPQLFSAAGRTDPAAAGANVSRVAGLGYLGMLAGRESEPEPELAQCP
jgi:pyruvate/2-oxoacid:ferredoxin oxidoreductase alpha subunit